MLEPKIIYEDKSIVVLDKPTGWITNDADTTTTQPVIQTWVRNNISYPLKGNKVFRDGVVHRLDKETSGILIIAKDITSFESLQSQFKNREVEKSYTALVHGRVFPDRGEIAQSVGRLPWRRDRFGVIPGGREAVTNYEVTKYFSYDGKDYSLLKLFPKTGRTHQIRIHLKHIGYPIVADSFYAGRKNARKDKKWCPRLFLHAGEIAFSHPKTNKRVSYASSLPNDLLLSLEKLKEVA